MRRSPFRFSFFFVESAYDRSSIASFIVSLSQRCRGRLSATSQKPFCRQLIYPNVTLLGQYYILPFGPTRPNQTRTSLLNCLKGNSAAFQNLIMETTISLSCYNIRLQKVLHRSLCRRACNWGFRACRKCQKTCRWS